jgi:NADP-dependent 3-hydroxy acid dehydrogenase YdfG
MTLGLFGAEIRVVAIDRDREPLEALAASASEQSRAADPITIQTDQTEDSAADEITKATRARFGRIDLLVQ